MRISVGIDVAKETHWVVALTETGEAVLDHAAGNDPAGVVAAPLGPTTPVAACGGRP